MGTKSYRYIITSALPYTNGDIHIGHLSGVFLPADIYNRYLKSNNAKTLFLSGSDEHGANILIKSIKDKKKPINIINKYHNKIKKNLKIFKISLNNYYRTSGNIHKKLALRVFYKLFKKKSFIKKTTYQYYDNKYKIFLADRFVVGICPICKNKESYSDLCEKCGSILNHGELINPISILTQKKPKLKKTTNFFLKFDRKFLISLYKKFKKLKYNKKVTSFVKNFINNKIKERSITRDIKWGIYINKIKKFKKYKNKVIYVWFEAILGYISSNINYNLKKKIKVNYWKNKKTRLINFIGKDNIVFHSIFYPTIIKGYNSKYILPYYINVNEFLKINNQKISTSKNKGIFLGKFLKFFPNFIDSLRYTLTMEMPINKDSNFTWKKFIYHNNSELIGILGNFINRSLTLINRYLNGYIPTHISSDLFNKYDFKVLKIVNKNYKNIGKNILKYKFRDSINKFINIARIGNKYLSSTSPWNLNENKIIKKILFITFQIIKKILLSSKIFLPYTYNNILKLLKISKKNIKKNKIILKENHKIDINTKILFKKFDKIEIEKIKKFF